jgi:hypothetical protein
MIQKAFKKDFTEWNTHKDKYIHVELMQVDGKVRFKSMRLVHYEVLTSCMDWLVIKN